MNDLQVQTQVVNEFKNFWTHTYVVWPNIEFDVNDLSVLEWVRISIIPADNLRKSLGDNPVLFRQYGVIIVEIYVDQGSGANRSVELADIAKTFFHNLNIPGLTIQSPSVSGLGPSGRWYQRNISCEYFTDNLI